MILQNSSKKKMSVKLYLLTLIVIYLTDSLLFATNANEIFRSINRFGLILIAFITLGSRLLSRNYQIPIYLLGLSTSIFISATIAGRFFNGYSYYTMIAALWFGYLYAEVYSLEDFSHAFCKIMRVIAIVSLLGWLFSGAIRSAGFIPVVTNTVGTQYKTLILTNTPLLAHLAKRNMGPFWEPGAYQVYLSVALYLTLFISKNRLKWADVVLLIVVTLTTLSGAALIPIILLIAAYLFEKKSFKSFTLVMLLCGLLAALLNTGVFDDIVQKMGGEDSTNSMTYRWIGIEGSLRGFLHSPLFGSTPETNEAIKSGLAMRYLGKSYASNTNTLVNYFAYYGIFVGGFMLVRSFKLIRGSVVSTLSAWLIFAAYLFSTSNENMTGSLLIVVLVFLRSVREYSKNKREALYESSAAQRV